MKTRERSVTYPTPQPELERDTSQSEPVEATLTPLPEDQIQEIRDR